MEILKLKQLHEQMIGSKPERIRLKRKALDVKEDADKELDLSVLDALDDVKEGEQSETDSEDENVNENKRFKIDKNASKSKKM
jgi:hypothetical protein